MQWPSRLALYHLTVFDGLFHATLKDNTNMYNGSKITVL